MKKLVTAITALACAAGLACAEVVSANIVGYNTFTANGEAAFVGVNFEKVGGGDANLLEVFDTSGFVDYLDNVAVFDPGSGEFTTYYWNGVEFDDIGNPTVSVGQAFLAQFFPETVVSVGQVRNTTTSHTHSLSAGASLISSAWPVPFKLSKFDWSNMVEWTDTIGLLNAGEGVFDTYYWDGIGFTQDGENYLPDELGGIGFAVLVANSEDVDIVETF